MQDIPGRALKVSRLSLQVRWEPLQNLSKGEKQPDLSFNWIALSVGLRIGQGSEGQKQGDQLLPSSVKTLLALTKVATVEVIYCRYVLRKNL